MRIQRLISSWSHLYKDTIYIHTWEYIQSYRHGVVYIKTLYTPTRENTYTVIPPCRSSCVCLQSSHIACLCLSVLFPRGLPLVKLMTSFDHYVLLPVTAPWVIVFGEQWGGCGGVGEGDALGLGTSVGSGGKIVKGKKEEKERSVAEGCNLCVNVVGIIGLLG